MLEPNLETDLAWKRASSPVWNNSMASVLVVVLCLVKQFYICAGVGFGCVL